MLTFSSFPWYCQILITGKGIGCFYKHNQLKCLLPPLNTTFGAISRSVLSSQNDSTNICGVTLIAHNKPLPVSNLTTTDQVDTVIKMMMTHSILQPLRKTNTEPLKYLKQLIEPLRFSLMLISNYTKWDHWLQQHHQNYLHMEKSIFVFIVMGNLLMQPSLPNQGIWLKLFNLFFRLNYLNNNMSFLKGYLSQTK